MPAYDVPGELRFEDGIPFEDAGRVRAYIDLIRLLIGTAAGAGLYGYDWSWLSKHKAELFTIRSVVDGRPDIIVAGVHGFRKGHIAELRGAVTHPIFQCHGLATALAARAALKLCAPGPTEVRCWIRQLPNGDFNRPSLRLFSRIGFAPAEIHTFRIVGDSFDRHLGMFADAVATDGQKTYRSLMMTATDQQIRSGATIALGRLDQRYYV